MGTPLFTGDVFQWARFCNVQMCEICKSLHELPCSTFLDIMNDIGIAYRQKAATFIYNQMINIVEIGIGIAQT